MHGWGGSTESFLGVAKAVSDRYRVTLLDFYGFGATPEPSFAVNINEYSEGVKDVFERVGIRRANIVAHSFGARVAIRFALRYPQCVEKMVLTGAAGMKPRRGAKYVCRLIRHRWQKRRGKSECGGSEDYRKLSAVMKKTFVNIVHCYQEKEIKKIKKPIWLIWGNKDRETPIYMGKRMRRLTGARWTELRGCGHFAYLERFDWFCDGIATYFSE